MFKTKQRLRCISAAMGLIALIGSTATANAQKDSKKMIDRTGWVGSASSRPGDVGRAFDNDSTTRWDSRASQVPDQWFQVDLQKEQPIKTVVLEYNKSANDGPRAYELQASNDGNSWTTVKASTEAPPKGLLSITLDKPSNARYIKIVQKGSKSQYWSLHELYVYKP